MFLCNGTSFDGRGGWGFDLFWCFVFLVLDFGFGVMVLGGVFVIYLVVLVVVFVLGGRFLWLFCFLFFGVVC